MIICYRLSIYSDGKTSGYILLNQLEDTLKATEVSHVPEKTRTSNPKSK